MKKIIAILAVLFSSCCHSEELIAKLDLKFIKDTGKTAGVMCYGDNEADCHTWATFYLYEAKVKKVVSGSLPENKFTVIYGRHALRKNNHKGVVVRLNKLLPDADAQYQISEFGQNYELVCFQSDESKNFSAGLELGNEKLKCAEKEEL
ncbi:MAG: hypothetical protein ACI4NJ_08445 [Cellvibrio sp.]